MPPDEVQARATREELNRLLDLLLKFRKFREDFLKLEETEEKQVARMREQAARVGVALADDQLKAFTKERREAFEKFAELRKEFNKTSKYVPIIPSSPAIAKRP
jgi:hypothetical protein